MPVTNGARRVLIIGSGAIVIGQAAEFDYAGSQACRALKDVGLEVVLVNPNPATIMTDAAMADRVYIEPLTPETVRRVILKERPDSLLSTLGGQSGLTLSMQLAREGFLDAHGVRLLGADLNTIERAEDRQRFKDTMTEIGQPIIPSDVVTEVGAAVELAERLGYPVIVRPAFTLGGSGGGIASDADALREIALKGVNASPIGQILVEKCVSGWKEIEFEVMRDARDNVITVCSMENLDPVGVHTGDSIVVAPALTLSDKEYQMLRSASLAIIRALRVEGGCNVQFALKPDSFEYAVIEVNPRVSRSSALASKATGYPIAKIAARIAVGFTLAELRNEVTGMTSACFEPALDYVVVKLPKWPFDKFVYAKRGLGTQMKATGEVMAIGASFEQALMKAVRGAEIGLNTLRAPRVMRRSDEELYEMLGQCTDERLFVLYALLSRGVAVEELYKLTGIDPWFLNKLVNLLRMERRLAAGDRCYLEAKAMGYPDAAIQKLTGKPIRGPRLPVYKMVDTCAAEFEARTPYFYATYDEENEAAAFIQSRAEERRALGLPDKPRVVVFGSGPIRIGQGIEFDYASVHCVWTLREMGCEVALVNNNPETVSTDFDTADRLYFEPLTPEDVAGVLAVERPMGVVVAFGGQTAIKLTRALNQMGMRILGSSADSIDAAEDREKFDELLNALGIERPRGRTVINEEEAVEAAASLGYPVLVRPSYVLGGQNMILAYGEADIREYMRIILRQGIENPVLIDQYLQGTELEVDAICDGEDILIPGIMEHIERAGVHSGDSIAVYPAWNLNGVTIDRLIEATRSLALGLGTVGLINIQYILHDNQIYVIEANPRASRTVPYISKVTGLPMVDVAVRVMLGRKLSELPYGTGLFRKSAYYAVKVPVFSFEKLADVDTQLGPEMKSTGEVLGVARTLEEALVKGLVAAGYRMDRSGGALFAVRDSDKPDAVRIARKYAAMGWKLYATAGTAQAFDEAGLEVVHLPPLTADIDSILALLDSGVINTVISTSSKGRFPTRASVRLRRKAVERSIPCLTSLDTAAVLANALASKYTLSNIELVNVAGMRHEKTRLRFVKMRGSGNDYIYFDCFEQTVDSPESISVQVSSRRFGVGGDGIVLILPPEDGHNGADAVMRMFNADGSEAELAGNALRCVAKYLYESGRVRKDTIAIHTEGGLKRVRVYERAGIVESARVAMGRVTFEPGKVPVKLGGGAGGEVIGVEAEVGGAVERVTCLSMGNPHCVIFVPDVSQAAVAERGAAIERDPVFPQRVNVSFAQVEGRHTLRMRTWERGIGETLSCGTGACAAAAAAVRLGLIEPGDTTARMPGGDLLVRVEDDEIWLTGDAVKDFEGVVDI
ncbi:MAG: carbamoyl-phosphate synthase large subunit [Oscillospiraceae bacterium]|jgi:carbamoyl-phosphate synthase large subunit|nr:carbamoyl-phosphate synthase large subunit [Oscillospiraceae bacterium]